MVEESGGWDPVIEKVEDWFVKRGVPHAIADYKATEDVFTRMTPYLVLVLLLGTLTTFGDRFRGWGQAFAFGGAVAIILGAAALMNRLRKRPAFAMPEDVGVLELLFFLTAAPILDLLFADNRVSTAIALFVTNLALLGIGYLVTSYGVIHMLRWGAVQMWREISGLLTLLARTLPLILLFATFLFINAEMWQVAHDITPVFYAMVIGIIFAAAIGFLAMRLPTEMESLQRFASWRDVQKVTNRCKAPTDDLVAHGEKPRRTPFDRGERLNILLLMLTAKTVQMTLAGALIGVFYVVFGLLTVGEETLLQWTEFTAVQLDQEALARFSFLGGELLVTWELFAVSGFIAAISSLQFAVSAITDEAYRTEFNQDIETEIREIMAVRALYLSHVRGTS